MGNNQVKPLNNNLSAGQNDLHKFNNFGLKLTNRELRIPESILLNLLHYRSSPDFETIKVSSSVTVRLILVSRI